jgi:hypothetical protein
MARAGRTVRARVARSAVATARAERIVRLAADIGEATARVGRIVRRGADTGATTERVGPIAPPAAGRIVRAAAPAVGTAVTMTPAGRIARIVPPAAGTAVLTALVAAIGRRIVKGADRVAGRVAPTVPARARAAVIAERTARARVGAVLGQAPGEDRIDHGRAPVTAPALADQAGRRDVTTTAARVTVVGPVVRPRVGDLAARPERPSAPAVPAAGTVATSTSRGRRCRSSPRGSMTG